MNSPRDDLRRVELGEEIGVPKSCLLVGEPVSGEAIGVIALPETAHGLDTSVTLLADCALIAVGQHLHRLDWAGFGKKWAVRYEAPIYSVIVRSDRVVVIYETGVSALALEDGKRLWSVPCDVVVSARVVEGPWIRIEDEGGVIREINSENGKTRVRQP